MTSGYQTRDRVFAELFGSKAIDKSRKCAMRYAIVIERADGNYCAYVPDLPGCIATGTTVEEAGKTIREAIEFHLDGLRQDGLQIPPPSSRVGYVEISF